MVTLDYRQLDWKLIAAVLLLSVIGIVTIFSAQYYADSAFKQTYYLRQLLWLAIALLAFVAVIHFPYRIYEAGAYWAYAVSLALLVLVLAVGSSRMGASRWFSLGSFSVSPSDIAKVACLLTLSRFFAYTHLPPASKRKLFLSAILALLPMILILKQPDLGTSLVFGMMLMALWFWSGLSPWYLLLILSPLVSLVTAFYWLSWAIYFVVLIIFLGLIRPGLLFSIVMVILNLVFGMITPMIWDRLRDYQKMRILVFLDPGHDPRGAGYQIIQSKIAIGSGGIFGRGYLNGSQARLDYLPERHTDFIFSVLSEEFGLWGALVVVGLFGFVFYRCLRIAVQCRSKFASTVVFGAMAIFFFQFFVNVGMTLGVMPVTGLPLPFVSYGGTALITSWVLVGLIITLDYYRSEY